MNEDEDAVVRDYELVESGFMAEFPYAIVRSIRNAKFAELLKFLPKEWLCGYIGVPESHPWFEQDRSEVDSGLEISYKGNNPEYPIQTTVPICWVGFDTYHYRFIADDTVMDVDLARLLVEQMAAAASEHYREYQDGTPDNIDDILPPRESEIDEGSG